MVLFTNDTTGCLTFKSNNLCCVDLQREKLPCNLAQYLALVTCILGVAG